MARVQGRSTARGRTGPQAAGYPAVPTQKGGIRNRKGAADNAGVSNIEFFTLGLGLDMTMLF